MDALQVFQASSIYCRGPGLTSATLPVEKEIPFCSRGNKNLKELRDFFNIPVGNTFRDWETLGWVLSPTMVGKGWDVTDK